MKEKIIKKHAVARLKAGGWVCWAPAKVRFYENDIFGVFDVICWREQYLTFIQLTSVSNIRTRERKVRRFLEKNKLTIPSAVYVEIWGIKKDKSFKIIEI